MNDKKGYSKHHAKAKSTNIQAWNLRTYASLLFWPFLESHTCSSSSLEQFGTSTFQHVLLCITSRKNSIRIEFLLERQHRLLRNGCIITNANWDSTNIESHHLPIIGPVESDLCNLITLNGNHTWRHTCSNNVIGQLEFAHDFDATYRYPWIGTIITAKTWNLNNFWSECVYGEWFLIRVYINS